MRNVKRVVGFPSWSPTYNKILTEFFEDLGLEVFPPRFPSKRAIDLAVARAAEMVCWPLKTTLAEFIEALDRGANSLVIWATTGRCRFHAYYIIQDQLLRDMGFKDFEMFVLRPRPVNLLRTLKRLAPGINYFRLAKKVMKVVRKLMAAEPSENPPEEGVKIGLIGEIYTTGNPDVNLGMEGKLRGAGCFVDNSITLSHFVREKLERRFLIKARPESEHRALKLLPEKIGGHGLHSIQSTLEYIDRGYEGIVFTMPLSCAPESLVEPIVVKLCKDSGTPLLIIRYDESTTESLLDTRIETFVEMLKRKEK